MYIGVELSPDVILWKFLTVTINGESLLPKQKSCRIKSTQFTDALVEIITPQ